MVFFTGDIHGVPKKIERFCRSVQPLEDDVIVILGDVGANYFNDLRDRDMKKRLEALAPTIFCIHGNHEQRPENIEGYVEKQWNGGTVYVQEEFPSVLFAKDGEIYSIGKYRYLVIGGAYSVDKYYRLIRGWGWWEDEQPNDRIKERVEQQVAEGQFDMILSHTCPYKYEPTEMFLPMVNQDSVDDSTERWLDTIEEKADYKAWYCGHWHTDKRIDKMHFLFDSFEIEMEEGLNE